MMLQSEREVRRFYEHSYTIISNRINRLADKVDEDSVVKRMYFEGLRQEISQQLGYVDNSLNALIVSNVNSVLTETLSVNNAYLNSMGFNYLTTNPALVVDMSNRIITGQLYGGNWNLSNAIWGNSVAIQQEIGRIISRGILQGQSTYHLIDSK